MKWNGNGDGQWGFKEAFEGRWKKKKRIAAGKTLLLASDIKTGFAIRKIGRTK